GTRRPRVARPLPTCVRTAWALPARANELLAGLDTPHGVERAVEARGRRRYLARFEALDAPGDAEVGYAVDLEHRASRARSGAGRAASSRAARPAPRRRAMTAAGFAARGGDGLFVADGKARELIGSRLLELGGDREGELPRAPARLLRGIGDAVGAGSLAA